MRLTALALIAIAIAAPADATTYQTTITRPSKPTSDFATDRLEITWSTPLTSGEIEAQDGNSGLSDLSWRLFDGQTLLFEDTILVDGVMQPIGGQPRGYFTFEMDLDALAADPTVLPDVFQPTPIPTSPDPDWTGEVYSIDWGNSGSGPFWIAVRSVDGVETGRSFSGGPLEATTRPVPVPAGLLLALSGVAALGVAARRRA